MSEYLEATAIKEMLGKPFKPSDVYAFIRVIAKNEPESVEKLFRFYRVKTDSFKKFCAKNNIELHENIRQ